MFANLSIWYGRCKILTIFKPEKSFLGKKVGNYASVKIGKGQGEYNKEFSANTSRYVACTFGYVNSLTYVILWGDET